MKRGTPDHPKMHDLRAALGIPIYSAVGLLELLWHFTAKYAERGDLGRHSNEAIARAVGWRGRPDKLVNALVACRWVDADPVHRLLVHDWQAHADEGVRKNLKNHGAYFLERFQNGSE
ncbi:MAG: hypothetical protein IMZ50_13395, partial [Candidatus Atribacteria bacterium]|nr:hypothetical protein [Candidatus Atribacteria bacterium]